MKTYNIGIIGYGGFGKFLHHSWSTLENVRIVAVSDGSLKDDDSESLRTYKDWQTLLQNPQIDIVSIATPPLFHTEIACAAMRAGKHVLVEKPVAINNEGAEAILKAQQETGKIVMVDHMLRYNPIIQALIQLSKSETFGKIRHAAVTNYAQDNALPADHWFWNKELSGGIFIEHGVHFFDIINALTTQRVNKVYGVSKNRNEAQQDQVSAMVLYDGGLVANHYHAFSGPGFFEETTIKLMYDLAKIEIKGWIPMSGQLKVLANRHIKDALDLIPGIQITKVEPISNLVDVSRPAGWGNTTQQTHNDIQSSGIVYDVNEMIFAEFEIQQSKSEVYVACLQNILKDLIQKIENPDHQPSVTVENAYESLKIAVLAERSSQNS